MRVSEIFGFDVENNSKEAWISRNSKTCPFRGTACTKASKVDPLGICSLSTGSRAASLCPVRFLEDNRIFSDAGRIAFGPDAQIEAFPEIRILTVPSEAGGRDRKIGKVDFLIGHVVDGKVLDFAAVEVQAAYFSGGNLRDIQKSFLINHHLNDVNADRRPDFRSSAQKRLVPQLALKIPVFRRWGKKFFVVVDSQFFGALPPFKATTESNSELTWLVYPFEKSRQAYTLGNPATVFSVWDDVQTALREGQPPDPSDILKELQLKLEIKVKKRRSTTSI